MAVLQREGNRPFALVGEKGVGPGMTAFVTGVTGARSASLAEAFYEVLLSGRGDDWFLEFALPIQKNAGAKRLALLLLLGGDGGFSGSIVPKLLSTALENGELRRCACYSSLWKRL
jgi:hypothetical protein